MKSSTYQPSLGFSLSVRKTRKAIFLDQMDRVVPWSRLVDLIAPYYQGRSHRASPVRAGDDAACPLSAAMFNLSDPAMEEAFFDTPLFREFVGLADNVRLPDQSTILRFRHRLEKHSLADKMFAQVNAVLTERGLMLKEGSAVDATLIAAPSSTKNKDKARDPEMYSSQKGNQWHFGMKAHIGTDADFGLVHTAHYTSGNAHDITQAHRLLHGHEKSVWADAGYQGTEKRPGADPSVTWHVAMRPGKRRSLRNAGGTVGELLEKAEKLKASVRAKVEHPFRVIKCQFGYIKTRYRGSKKNATQMTTLFALSNLWMARHR